MLSAPGGRVRMRWILSQTAIRSQRRRMSDKRAQLDGPGDRNGSWIEAGLFLTRLVLYLPSLSVWPSKVLDAPVAEHGRRTGAAAGLQHRRYAKRGRRNCAQAHKTGAFAIAGPFESGFRAAVSADVS